MAQQNPKTEFIEVVSLLNLYSLVKNKSELGRMLKVDRITIFNRLNDEIEKRRLWYVRVSKNAMGNVTGYTWASGGDYEFK